MNTTRTRYLTVHPSFFIYDSLESYSSVCSSVVYNAVDCSYLCLLIESCLSVCQKNGLHYGTEQVEEYVDLNLSGH